MHFIHIIQFQESLSNENNKDILPIVLFFVSYLYPKNIKPPSIITMTGVCCTRSRDTGAWRAGMSLIWQRKRINIIFDYLQSMQIMQPNFSLPDKLDRASKFI